MPNRGDKKTDSNFTNIKGRKISDNGWAKKNKPEIHFRITKVKKNSDKKLFTHSNLTYYTCISANSCYTSLYFQCYRQMLATY